MLERAKAALGRPSFFAIGERSNAVSTLGFPRVRFDMRRADGSNLLLTLRGFHMRALLLLVAGLFAASPDIALAQAKSSPKGAAPSSSEVRYFTSIDGLMDG